MTTRGKAIVAVLLAISAFMAWRFVRPMNIFAVSPAFERPMSTTHAPEMLGDLSAETCAICHPATFDEWSTTIHSQAWTDPYYQVDFVFDGSQQICLNCHIPLDRQQENLVLGFRDAAKWDPILAPNPDFDPALQKEGVTCAACHLKGDAILGTRDSGQAPHPVEKLENGNLICVRCHVVSGERWDTFFRFPPCGTVAEITATSDPFDKVKHGGAYGEMSVEEVAALNCIGCHMPIVERPVAQDGEERPIRKVRRHLWRGGHDPDMVKSALTIDLSEQAGPSSDTRRFTLSITNTGAAHYVPTGTPDRHLTVDIKLLYGKDEVIDEQNHILKRTIMWRPFIIDLWDSRLPRGEERTFDIAIEDRRVEAVEAVVRYFLVDEQRRKRIGFENKTPLSYEVYRKRISLR